MTLSGSNYYAWNNSSSLMNSQLLSLTFKDHRGETLTVQDSNEDIEITIPRGITTQNVVSHYVKPSSKGKMQYHKLTLSSLPDNGTNLTLTVSMMSTYKYYLPASIYFQYSQMKEFYLIT